MTIRRSRTWRAPAVRLAGGAAVLLLAAGCTELNPGSGEAAATAQQFHQLVDAGKTGAACRLLAPGTAEEIEGGNPGSCAAKLSRLGLVPAAAVLESQAYGREAQVRLDGDTVFLTRSGDRWVVTAAGCTARNERPYLCEVKGD
jgi:hypothetical protein